MCGFFLEWFDFAFRFWFLGKRLRFIFANFSVVFFSTQIWKMSLGGHLCFPISAVYFVLCYYFYMVFIPTSSLFSTTKTTLCVHNQSDRMSLSVQQKSKRTKPITPLPHQLWFTVCCVSRPMTVSSGLTIGQNCLPLTKAGV